jgi:steroid delta-isomerase-like uncharacterized protein
VVEPGPDPGPAAAIVRRYLEDGLGGGDAAVVRQLRSPAIAWHGGPLGEAHGAEELARRLEPVHAAFPDLSVTIEELISGADTVAARMTLAATHSGHFFGVPATGRRVTWSAMSIYRVEDGRIAEQWLEEDWASVLAQLGALDTGI